MPRILALTAAAFLAWCATAPIALGGPGSFALRAAIFVPLVWLGCPRLRRWLRARFWD